MGMIAEDKTKTWWPDEDISRSLSLLVKSKSAYQLLRKDWKMPLPSVSTIGNHLAKVPMDPGLILAVLSLMKAYFEEVPEMKRQAILVHDEMNLDASVSYDPSSDIIYGPHKNASVILVRGLYGNWKFPIFYGFDQKYNKETFDEIIKRLLEIRVNVVGITSDNSGANRGIWTRLGIKYNQPFFPHPITEQPVYGISDVPHNLKLLRCFVFYHYGRIISL